MMTIGSTTLTWLYPVWACKIRVLFHDNPELGPAEALIIIHVVHQLGDARRQNIWHLFKFFG